MRKAGALGTAVLLALALGAHGCGLVDSLTPFGIGTRDYSTEGDNVNGVWTGTAGAGGVVGFQVGNAEVNEMLLQYKTADCTITFAGDTGPVPIIDGAFTIERDLTSLDQGRIVITGRFTSSNTCVGSFSFEGLPASSCPTSGVGSFTAEKAL